MDGSTDIESKIKVLLAVARRASAEELLGALCGRGDVDVVGVARDGEDAMAMALELRPEVAIISQDLSEDHPDWSGPRLVELVRWLTPGVGTVLLSKNGIPGLAEDDRVRLADEVLSGAPAPDEVLRAVRRLGNRPQLVVPKKRSTIAVTAAKGGVGKTTVACNLALALALDTAGEEDKVALFDLYTQYGSTQRVLGIEAPASAVDLSCRLEDLDGTLLEAHMGEHPSGLRLLVASRRSRGKEALYSSAAQILSTIRRSFRFVVLDVPNEISNTVRAVLPYCSKVLVVTNLNEFTAVEQTTEMYEDLQAEGVGRDRIIVVLNKRARRNRLRVENVRRLLPDCAIVSLPDDAKVNEDNNAGTPTIVTRPRSPFARAIRQLVESSAHTGRPAGAP